MAVTPVWQPVLNYSNRIKIYEQIVTDTYYILTSNRDACGGLPGNFLKIPL